ncbi:MAG: type II toxin-antitoxin system death-on-curing family toxin [Chloroflexi bacterium]|nr:type II toxin-antitoxin system death-on-curing family toxin [Chloroflexota bacterium]
MKYLTPQQVLFLHSRIIAETGGSHGIRDVGALESALARPRMTFGGEDLYPDVFSKAAALLESIIRNHPFIDGNKRTGIAAAALFLLLNGWLLVADNEELESFTLRVAQSQTTFDEIVQWLREHSRPLSQAEQDSPTPWKTTAQG